MGWFIDRVEDGNAVEERYERMCPWLDYSHFTDAFREFSNAADSLYDTHVLSPAEKRDLAMYQGMHPSDTIHLLEWCWARRVSATGRSSEHSQVFSSFG